MLFGGVGCIAMWAGCAARPTSKAYPTVGELRQWRVFLATCALSSCSCNRIALLLFFSPLLPVGMLHAPCTCHGTMLVPSWTAEDLLGPWDKLSVTAQSR